MLKEGKANCPEAVAELLWGSVEEDLMPGMPVAVPAAEYALPEPCSLASCACSAWASARWPFIQGCALSSVSPLTGLSLSAASVRRFFACSI